ASPTKMIRPARTATSALRGGAPVPSTTVPPEIRMSAVIVCAVAGADESWRRIAPSTVAPATVPRRGAPSFTSNEPPRRAIGGCASLLPEEIADLFQQYFLARRRRRSGRCRGSFFLPLETVDPLHHHENHKRHDEEVEY